MGTKTKRTLCGAGAIILALALAIGGTFAYNLFEHKSNPFTSDVNYQARLVEDFDPNPDWEVDTDIKKEVSVKNMGGEEDFPQKDWGNIYVRVLLKEFMQITPVSYEYYVGSDSDPVRFMVDKNGDFVKFPVDADLQESIDSFDWSKVVTDEAKRNAFLKTVDVDQFVKVSSLYDTDENGNPVEYWYLPTKPGDPNGQYGAWVVTAKTLGTPQVIAGTALAATEDDECNYPVHKWGKNTPEVCGFGTHDYVQWNLNDDAVIMLSDWIAQGRQDVAKWILDPETGYATWGQALPPKPANNQTELLLKSITPKIRPDGELTYVIHVDMEVASEQDMSDDWVIKKKTSVKFETGTVTKNLKDGTAVSPAIKGLEAGDTVVDWSSSKEDVATVDQNGNVTLVGEGTTTITVTVKHNDGRPDEVISYELTVTKDIPSNIELNTDNKDLYNEDDGFSTDIHLSNDNENFSFNVYIDLDFVEIAHAASIPLEKVLKTSDYTGLSIVPLDSRFAGNNKDGNPIFSIKNDTRNGGKPSLFFDWYPATMAEQLAIDTWNGPHTFGKRATPYDGSTPIITTMVKLTKGEGADKIESEPFKVTIHYTQSVFAYE